MINYKNNNCKIKDRLTSVNGKAITYGTNPLNPISYNGNTFTWEGRRLLKYNNIEYTYDEQGLRTRKKVNGSTTKYYYDRTNLITEVNPSYRLDFLYDAEDQLYGFIYNNSSDKYYYVRDFMQNILGIIDSNGKLVVRYTYTAYGRYSATGDISLDYINPFKYKGYYYDSETGMYYCKSRYYVYEWCRWLNGDNVAYLDTENINGMNLFSYCGNNPVMYVDESGCMPWWCKLLMGVGIVALSFVTLGAAAGAGAVIGAAVGALSGFTIDENGGWSYDVDKGMNGLLCGAVTGAISGAVSGAISNGFSIAGHAIEKGSIIIKGIKAGVDGLLAMGSYFAQAGVNHTDISFLGALISLGSGVFNILPSVGKIFDAIWVPTIGSELAWAYDTYVNNMRIRNQN